MTGTAEMPEFGLGADEARYSLRVQLGGTVAALRVTRPLPVMTGSGLPSPLTRGAATAGGSVPAPPLAWLASGCAQRLAGPVAGLVAVAVAVEAPPLWVWLVCCTTQAVRGTSSLAQTAQHAHLRRVHPVLADKRVHRHSLRRCAWRGALLATIRQLPGHPCPRLHLRPPQQFATARLHCRHRGQPPRLRQHTAPPCCVALVPLLRKGSVATRQCCCLIFYLCMNEITSQRLAELCPNRSRVREQSLRTVKRDLAPSSRRNQQLLLQISVDELPVLLH